MSITEIAIERPFDTSVMRIACRKALIRVRGVGGSAMFALAVRFTIRDEESAQRFDELTAEVVEQIRINEPGTLVYATAAVEGEPLARLFYEVYADQEV